jgi:hypothetical protein
MQESWSRRFSKEKPDGAGKPESRREGERFSLRAPRNTGDLEASGQITVMGHPGWY